MFFKIASLLSFALAVAAAPDGTSCSTGQLQCCDTIAPSSSTNTANPDPLSIVPIALQGLNVPLGLNCLPINILGAGSSGTCNTQTACCNGVSNEGTVPIGLNCDPINLGF